MIRQLSVGFKHWVAGSQSQLRQIMSRPQASRRLSTLKRVIKAAASLDEPPHVKWEKVPLHSGRNSLSWLNEWYEGWRVKGGGSLNPTEHNWGVLTKRRGRDAECVHCHWQQSLSVGALYMTTHPQPGIPYVVHKPYNYAWQPRGSPYKSYSGPMSLKSSKHQIGGCECWWKNENTAAIPC